MNTEPLYDLFDKILDTYPINKEEPIKEFFDFLLLTEVKKISITFSRKIRQDKLIIIITENNYLPLKLVSYDSKIFKVLNNTHDVTYIIPKNCTFEIKSSNPSLIKYCYSKLKLDGGIKTEL